jgi:uncharacterized protein YceK
VKKLLLAAVVSASTLVSGCATIFGDTNRNVHITSTPDSANVYYNGTMVGTTPVNLTVDNPMSQNTIVVEKDGYYKNMKPLDVKFQGVGWFNILFWPGFIVDYMTGDMKRVEPNMNFSLEKKAS